MQLALPEKGGTGQDVDRGENHRLEVHQVEAVAKKMKACLGELEWVAQERRKMLTKDRDMKRKIRWQYQER